MTAHPLEMIANEGLRERIAAIRDLPTLPETYKKLTAELGKSDVSMSRIAAIVSTDVAITAKLLHVANSAVFGARAPIESVTQSLNMLGVENVRGIVLAAGAYQVEFSKMIPGYLPHEIYGRAINVGTKSRFIAYSLGLKRQEVDDALTAGLLHDVGKLVLLTKFASEFERALHKSRQESTPLHIAQEQLIGSDDAVIGAFLLSTWGIPEPIVDAVAKHYTPSKYGEPALDANAAVHLAWASEHDRQLRKGDPTPSAFDRAYTDALGVTSQLSSFVGLSPEAVTQGAGAR
jgi:HD-like signal output (HDOD) protein